MQQTHRKRSRKQKKKNKKKTKKQKKKLMHILIFVNMSKRPFFKQIYTR